MASSLSAQVTRLEHSIAVLRAIADSLRYTAPPMRRLIADIAAQERFSQVGYIQDCRANLQQGMPFPVSWRHAVDGDALLGVEHADILLPLGDVLGHTEVSGQLAALEHASAMLETRLEQARGYEGSHARLYRSLGFFGGLAIAVILL